MRTALFIALAVFSAGQSYADPNAMREYHISGLRAANFYTYLGREMIPARETDLASPCIDVLPTNPDHAFFSCVSKRLYQSRQFDDVYFSIHKHDGRDVLVVVYDHPQSPRIIKVWPTESEVISQGLNIIYTRGVDGLSQSETLSFENRISKTTLTKSTQYNDDATLGEILNQQISVTQICETCPAE
ncbi:hypothetical protein GCM10008927_20910 [Amylibacter ulvae]|uniref:Uncharacterized protein n=1 Tax=Paramylibacter ulvae TaxID=1651968 RepID=A0ABQ3D4D2_9RHOB|nr:hypothetical protein [Amylibacter ulvae]GHA54904.1 hypothetical protein GCM10008927_20910 [Amylibacter ulvae]